MLEIDGNWRLSTLATLISNPHIFKVFHENSSWIFPFTFSLTIWHVIVQVWICLHGHEDEAKQRQNHKVTHVRFRLCPNQLKHQQIQQICLVIHFHGKLFQLFRIFSFTSAIWWELKMKKTKKFFRASSKLSRLYSSALRCWLWRRKSSKEEIVEWKCMLTTCYYSEREIRERKKWGEIFRR